MMRRVILALAVLAIIGVTFAYQHCIGFPRKIAGHWVHPRVTWYWTSYPPLGYPYPGVVQYVYVDANGKEIKHGPLVERTGRGSFSVVLSKTGFYLEGQPDGLFTEYQTYWGTKSNETLYDHGKQISVKWYPVPPR